jgi:DNA-directed RNA polymerase specialized sigma24 family protein
MESHNFSRASNKGGRDDGIPRLELLSISELAHHCSEETVKFLKQHASNDLYCLELFRRAIGEHDDSAWACIYQQYAPLVLTWVTQHQSVVMLVGQDGYAALVNAAFAKFAQALTPVKMSNFDALAAVLKYLKMCVHSVVADEVRSYQARQYEETLESIDQEPASDDPANAVIASLAVQDVWQVILEEVNSEEERVLIHLVYMYGMKPSEICQHNSHLFPTVDDVYRIKRNVLERLRRNHRLQELLQQ